MTKIAKYIFLTLMAISININVLANNDTIILRFSPTKNQSLTNLIASEQGKPNIKYISKYVAIPRDAEFNISIATKNEIIRENTYIEPATNISSDYDSIDLQCIEDKNVYSKDEYFPKEIISFEKTTMRDADIILISVAIEQFNPVRKTAKIFEDIEVRIYVKERKKSQKKQSDRLTEMLKNVVENPGFFKDTEPYSINGKNDGCNYLIVIPDNEEIRIWADTLKKFREEQGIMTKVVSLKEIGKNKPDSLKKFFRNAVDNWDPAPEAVLLLGDFNLIGFEKGITTYMRTDHPEGNAFEPYLTDNQLVDFNNDNIADIAIARMPAANGEEARLMVEKTLNYERQPSENELYYKKPVTAMGFQENRWFQLCTEILGGYWETIDKQCVRINAIHEGTPDSVWSTGQNTGRVIEYFGPNGLGYIPSTMSHLTDWSGDENQITAAINDGSFMVVHRDHGTYETWGEPYYSTSCINALSNEDLTFVFSANCQTGHFGYGDNEHDCFAERFMRAENGAVAVVAASELSYSYVNDTYVWGFFDYLYPDFMPDYGSQNIDFQYPAFANVYGKLFLKKSSFPSNTDKIAITNRLFHYFGDAYLQLNSEFPDEIEISHPDSIQPEQTQITVSAENGTHVALSVDGQLITKGKSNDGTITLCFNKQKAGKKIKVVATKQNHFRHESFIKIAGASEDVDVTSFEIYPNPCIDKIHIKGKSIYNIKIINILGQVVKTYNFSNSDDIEIDASDLSCGIYSIIINSSVVIKIGKTG